ncbi:NAD-dependent deacylase [Elizabethkingia argentiflava]|uniref:NAD-dependent protein deacylase n=1 Tax=Elizabethkingia argenteiflava TaxID=2681556 RepID=A0A845PZ15_9FLAO|nr:NAD-dependent deacylase [Elizabethkingia argenteiflava]NAW52151.1 NAD-dependent deacylase [Elizabethkingia argenteiflava]
MKKIVVLSGAGISAESGIKTFRDSNGLWENHSIEEVASPEGFLRNPQKVLDFYNLRRKQLKEVTPNEAHYILAALQQDFDIHIITQNVDDLHERAGSQKVLHLHGELKKVRPVNNENKIIPWEEDLNWGDQDEEGTQLRPHIVWFGEMVPEMDKAINITSMANILLIVGTSLQVYPAASLMHYIPEYCQVFVIDPHLDEHLTSANNFFKTSATKGMKLFRDIIISER